MVKLEEEAALFARNCDVEEELVRLRHHLDAFAEAIKTSKKDIGKKLDFIAQEMHREANTIGSKAAYYILSKKTIDISGRLILSHDDS